MQIPTLRARWLAPLLVVSLGLAACGDDDEGDFTFDDGGPRDAGGGESGIDADRPPDSGPSRDATAADAGTDAGECTPITEVPYADHTENEELTDPPACDGCPGAFEGTESLDVGALAPGATTLSVSGRSPGANRCEWFVLGGACGVTHGVLGTDPDGSGAFSATLPVFCGVNVVQIVCESSSGRRIFVRRLMGTACEGRDVRLTLGWDDQGTDMELHLIREGGRINSTTDDCTWFTCMAADGLEWGAPANPADNPRKDVDNTGYLGPENIYLDEATDGVYHVLVEFWGAGNPSHNQIDVTIGETTVAHLERTLAQHEVWYVGRLHFPESTWEPVDTTVDCSSAWRLTSMGCDMPLPP